MSPRLTLLGTLTPAEEWQNMMSEWYDRRQELEQDLGEIASEVHSTDDPDMKQLLIQKMRRAEEKLQTESRQYSEEYKRRQQNNR